MSGGGNMKLSARNALKGKIKEIKAGTVNTEVIVELKGGEEIVSMISKDSAEKMGLKPGKEIYAVIKASSVMIGTD